MNEILLLGYYGYTNMVIRDGFIERRDINLHKHRHVSLSDKYKTFQT